MPHATTLESGLVERQRPTAEMAAVHFPWSVAKLRIAGLALFGSAVPSVLGCAASAPWLQGLCLLWLLTVAGLMQALQRRVSSKAVVLSIDRYGICDRRLMSRPISWQEIEAVCRVDTDRSKVVDIKLRWPEATLRDTRLAVRIGVYCQQAYGVPAVTISMLLLDGTVCGLLEAIAQYRPDLLHVANRGRLRHAIQAKA